MDYPPSILPPVKRIIVIGDIHGDLKATIIALKKAAVIDNHHNWIGGTTVVVQMGDQVDRRARIDNNQYDKDEDSELKIINIFDKLAKQAAAVGGAVFSLLGNHELMNVMGDFTYVSPMGIMHFGSYDERLKAFKPGGKIATHFAKSRNVIIKIGDFLFVHGGLLPSIAAKYRINDINNLMRAYLVGNKGLESTTVFHELFLNMGSLLWTRRYSEDKPDCTGLYKALELYGAKYLIVGHTPQNGINCKCKSRVWRVDTGMSEAFGKHETSRIQILEILNNGAKINII